MEFACRAGCGACCIAPSIATPFFGMPNGKPAGERCVHLDGDNMCTLFGRPERPQFCSDLRASPEMCGDTTDDAIRILTALERATRPRGYCDAIRILTALERATRPRGY